MYLLVDKACYAVGCKISTSHYGTPLTRRGLINWWLLRSTCESALGGMQNVCVSTLIVFTLQSVVRIFFIWSTTFSGIWVSRRPLMLSRWKIALCALCALFDCWIYCVLSGQSGAQYWRSCVKRYSCKYADSVDSLGDPFCPLFRAGWLA